MFYLTVGKTSADFLCDAQGYVCPITVLYPDCLNPGHFDLVAQALLPLRAARERAKVAA